MSYFYSSRRKLLSRSPYREQSLTNHATLPNRPCIVESVCYEQRSRGKSLPSQLPNHIAQQRRLKLAELHHHLISLSHCGTNLSEHHIETSQTIAEIDAKHTAMMWRVAMLQ